MTFNPYEEKGTPLEKQLRSWSDIAKKPYNKTEVNNYSRCRQILMNGIEVEAWNFKHSFARYCPDEDLKKLIVQTSRIEDTQQTTMNWLDPEDQSVLETTLAYEQIAVDITAWMAQNEPDKYVKETFDFGLLEDFDHLYRYSQWADMEHGICPNAILQGQTDVIVGRPTQNHHNDNALRIREHYTKDSADPQTKVNILTLVSAEQQTHNYYAEHGFMYGSPVLRETYAEIKDVEEEHVTMYESLIDPTESPYEKLLMHEFTEVCNYYTCMEDEEHPELKAIWEEFLAMELGHLHLAKKIFEKYENRDAEEVTGKKIVIPSRFKSQKKYVTEVLMKEVDKRLGMDKDYTTVKELPEDWTSYNVQAIMNGEGSPTETTIELIGVSKGYDVVKADKSLRDKEVELLEKGLQRRELAPDTVFPEELAEMRANDPNME